MTEPKKMSLESLNIKENQISKLKEIFPEAFTEGTQIDWEKLRLTLGENIDPGKERFGLTWPGKGDCFKTIQQPSIATLVPAREESINFDDTENIFIEGDNLEALKLLQKSYLGKIKMIYIDPPYNTGNEFIYPDNYAEGLNTYLEYTGQIDNEGKKFSTNTETDGRFHSKWLNMMYPRLFLARNLLSNDGAIFISIDDTEYSNLKSVCNELFGEDCFIATFIWEKRTNRENRKLISNRHDYILCYCKDSTQKDTSIEMLPMSSEAISRYKNPDNDPRGLWKSDPATAQAGHGTKGQFYVLKAPNGKEHNLQSGRCWLYTESVMHEAIKDNRIWFGRDGNGVPRIKTYLEAKERALNPESILFANDVSTNENAKKNLKDLFDGVAVFETPKPVELIRLLLTIGAKNGIVLDFFAGSSATAEAVLRNGNNNRFITIQLPEKSNEDSEAMKAGFRTISDLGKERIRRVINKLKIEREAQQAKSKQTLFEDDDETFTDLGFKVFKLNPSNFKIWDSRIEKNIASIQTELDLNVEHINQLSQEESILYELLLKSGFELSTPIEKSQIEGRTIFSISKGNLLICLDKNLTYELIKAIAERQPSRVILLDEGFHNNDQLKTNAVQIMKSKNVLNFRTV